eukprot:15465605-Alexandrium_andersonii.AAC.1
MAAVHSGGVGMDKTTQVHSDGDGAVCACQRCPAVTCKRQPKAQPGLAPEPRGKGRKKGARLTVTPHDKRWLCRCNISFVVSVRRRCWCWRRQQLRVRVCVCAKCVVLVMVVAVLGRARN